MIVLLTEKGTELIMENRLRDFIYPARSKISKFRIAFKKTGEYYEPVVPRILPDAENSTSTDDTSQCLDNHQDQQSELSQSSIDEENLRKSDDTGATFPSETYDIHTDSCEMNMSLAKRLLNAVVVKNTLIHVYLTS